MTRTVLQIVDLDTTGDSCYRMRWPAQVLAQQHPEWRVINLQAHAQERYEWGLAADLLVLIQCQDEDFLPIIEARRAQGKKTLVEYNDNFYAPPPWSPAATAWGSPFLWHKYERFLRLADAVMVTGPGLQQLFGSKTDRPIYILENHLPRLAHSSWASKGTQIKLGWAGSLGHMADILAVMPTLKQVLEQFPQVKLCLMGNEAIPKLINLPPERIEFTNWGTMEEYFNFWQGIHIGIAPLLDTDYNNCRSDVKAIEMSGCQVLPILQDQLPYHKFIEQTQLPSFSNYRELHQLLNNLLADPQHCHILVQKAHQYTQSQRLASQCWERAQLYESLFPPQSTTFAWPVEAGYQELTGITKMSSSWTATYLQQAQQLWQTGNHSQAFDSTVQCVKANPFCPEAALRLLQYLRKLNSSQLHENLQKFQTQFPEDLRFILFTILITDDLEQRLMLWQQLEAQLGILPSTSRGYYWALLVKPLTKELRNHPTALAIGIAFGRLYPEQASLHLELAQAHERDGDFIASLKHFAWLEQQIELYHPNQSFLATLDANYVRAWTATLKARVEC